MKEELIDPHVQFPGLQIFSSWKNSSKNVRNLQNTSKRPAFNQHYLPSEETLVLAVHNDPNQFGSWVKFPERRSTDLHDYSPTVVGSDCFEKYEIPQKPETAKFWSKIISEIFRELPDDSNDQFIEEFQYTVISSDSLNDPNGFRFSFSAKKSIMDFHKSSSSLQRHDLATLPTKYGRLRIFSPSRFTLIRTLDILSTVLCAWKLLRCLGKPRINTMRCRRILAAVLIALYLATQQEYFHSQYARYKALVTLKKMLTSLQKLSTLIHNYGIKLKELSIYKPLSTSKPGTSPDPTIAKIKDLLSSCLDLLYYKLKSTTENLIPLCSTASLTKYCAMYNLEMSDLFHYLNEAAPELEDKSERMSIMRKFTLCTLLSLSCYNSSSDETMMSFLSRLFPDSILEMHETSPAKDADRYRAVSENLQQFDDFAIQLTSSLVNHKHILRSYGDLSEITDDNATARCRAELPKTNQQLNETLQSLKRLESFLVACQEEEISKETRDVVTYSLQEITSAWRNYDTPNNQCDRPFLTSPKTGFSLKVLKKPSWQSLKSIPKNGNMRLKDEIAFEQVDDMQSDMEFDSDLERHNSYEKLCYESARSESDNLIEPKAKSDGRQDLRELTDDELRHKLNEGISRLAVENRQGRDRIRTQKSFELLRQKDITKRVHRHASIMSKDSMTIVQSRPPNESNFSSEDSIPVLYELKELLEKQQ
ncbi:hypothetical protein HG536_0A02760 [Torulaspora globosa]|uniref:Inheritance of peroxisomes protein 2 n=1 Tax=Torulaspora globosa TaxID=48254 RepID=A0A7G3ZAC3_9SACH|nr:uncharacterized protein HG536_0A02760 [Torulaspora globosa]QLL30459.1 hypothetical protein HG536_0A02760 [Torulaspora globosa]